VKGGSGALFSTESTSWVLKVPLCAVVQRLVVAARGGCRWPWVEEEVGLGFGEKRGRKSCFLVGGHIYNLQDSLSELVSLSEI